LTLDIRPRRSKSPGCRFSLKVLNVARLEFEEVCDDPESFHPARLKARRVVLRTK
jgi:hypothetical protein